MAEGIRKLGMLAYLVTNGSLSENGFLFWDEPEANMNPKLTRLTGEVVLGLARSGVQTVLATLRDLTVPGVRVRSLPGAGPVRGT